MNSLEREALTEKRIKKFISVSLVEINQTDVYSLQLKFGLTNMSNKTIIGIQGTAKVRDIYGRTLISSPVKIDEAIPPAQTIYTLLSVTDKNTRLSPETIRPDYKITGILFEDGEKLLLKYYTGD